MDRQPDVVEVARAIIDSHMYLTLATADADGQPWASPVYFAADGYGTYYWVSSPEARHSRNIAVRPAVSIVIFDSGASINTGQAVYMEALAEELTGGDLEQGIAVFSRRSHEHGARVWTLADVRAPAAYRLYRAQVSEHFTLDPASSPDARVPVHP
jgi:putative heme iron utilization protein